MQNNKNIGCVLFAILAVVIGIIPTVIKTCNEKRELHNSPWYQEMQAKKDSIERLNKLAKTNPEEYNRIIRQEKMWKFTTEDNDNTIFATIKSKNKASISLPQPIKKYKKSFIGTKDYVECYVVIEYIKNKGSDVIVKIAGTKHNLDSDHCYISVKFDNESKYIKYEYDDFASMKDRIILKNSNDFINHCKTATHISLSIPITYTTHVTEKHSLEYEFDIPEPLVWNH